MSTRTAGEKAPFADTPLAEASVEVESRDDGSWVLWSPEPLDPGPDHMIVKLHEWAERTPDRTFLAERGPDGEWRRLSYGAAARQSAGIGQALIDRGHGPDRPVAILSDNSIDFGLLLLGAMQAAIPVMPVSSAYSLMSKDHAKLKYVIENNDPSVVFAADPTPFAAALAALDLDGRTLMTSTGEGGTESLAAWAETEPGPVLAERLAGVGPDTVAKILLTSGSTGVPKGVINTQRMMVSNQVMTIFAYRFLARRPPVIVDWLPWNHTFAGNFNFNLILFHGGTYYLDGGRPVPGRFDETLRNLHEISPTLYLNVPRGYDVLIPALEADPVLRDKLMCDLDVLFFAGAALPQSSREGLQALSVAARGDRIPIVTSLGSTETAPASTYMTWDSDVWGNIGVPLPGTAMKLVPNGDKLEVRFKGPHVSPGYYKDPEKTAASFDKEGYFSIGDAGKFLDPADAAKGVLFDGRVAENFKLSSGTWVAAGTLRLAVLSAATPILQDAVITGLDRDGVGILGIPSPAGCRGVCPDIAEDASMGAIIAHPEVRARLAQGLAAYNRENPGGSTRITRALMLAEPPQIDAGEITDKGYVNQRAMLDHRAADVDRLYADPLDDGVMAID